MASNPWLADAQHIPKCPVCNVRLLNGSCLDHGPPKPVEPKAEELKAEEPKAEEPKAEEPRAEEATTLSAFEIDG